jgi:superfamily II DNA or RNA helicase
MSETRLVTRPVPGHEVSAPLADAGGVSTEEKILSTVTPFASSADLSVALELEGLTHLATVALAALLGQVDPALRPQVRSASHGRRLVELLAADTHSAWLTEMRPTPAMQAKLPLLAAQWLAEERAGVVAARSELAERLRPPDDPRTHPLHRLLLQLRAAQPGHLAPRPLHRLLLDRLTQEPQLPGLRVVDLRYPVLIPGGERTPDVRISFGEGGPSAVCSCGAGHCVHLLAALDTALVWLRQPLTDSVTAFIEELARAPWERTLRALEKAVAVRPAAAPEELIFRLDVQPRWGVFVTASLRSRAGRRSERKLTRERLLSEPGLRLSDEDERVVRLLNEGPASRALLAELVDHPRLFVDHDGAAGGPVRLDRATVGLVVQARGDDLLLTAGLDGTPLPPEVVSQARATRAEEPVYLWHEESRIFTLLDVAPEVKAALGALHKQGALFPPEAREALLEQLGRMSARVPVALPRSVLGAEVPLQDLQVLRFETQAGGQVWLLLRTRPLHESGSCPPGEGPRDVHARRGDRAIHAVRDLAKELLSARALQARLPLDAAELEEGPATAPFTFLLPGPQHALAVLSAARALDPAPLLEWDDHPLRVYKAQGLQSLTVAVEKRRDWFGVLGGLKVEGERVELARLIEAARRRERFVRVGDGDAGAWVELEERLQRHLQRLGDHLHASKHGLDLGPSAVGELAALGEGGAQVDADASWRDLAARVFAAGERRPAVPASLKATLRPYQKEGFAWLSRLASWGAGGVLADDMGLGKTVQALALLLERAKLGPALVVAPASVGFNWAAEAARFAPSLQVRLLLDETDRAAALASLGPRDVLVVSYGLLVRDREKLAQVNFASVIFDEAQQLKNHATLRFRAARALQAGVRVALSGTPLENALGDLWSVFAVVFPGLLGSAESFRNRFGAPIERARDPQAAQSLARVLQPFLLRRTKAQVASELPPRTEVQVQIVLSPAEWQQYEDERLAALAVLEASKKTRREEERRIEILAALTRLRLRAAHPRLCDPRSTTPSAKLERLVELLRELGAEGERALVFSQFTTHLALVRERLEAEQIAYEELDGSTPSGQRRARVQAFQEGSAPVFLLSLKAGGVGLNLTAATSVILLDPWWNPAVEDQAADRAHRLGQTRPVTIYRLVARGTIEEKILGLHARKRELVASVLEGKELAGRLTSQELFGLLAQGAVAVEPRKARTRH